ncbi:MAG: winged helix-turn-helix transcriptional regulator [Lachnospiraceae bacterium]|nr:winged helix-turn-helix transcriptional regulator [Lachnospiraceae bacterium]
MMHIKSLDEGVEVFKALGSEIRVEIIKLLIKNKGMNMNSLANALNITNGALTSHVRKLEECGIVSIMSESAGHGNQKRCMVHLNKILVEFSPDPKKDDAYETEIKVGQYTDYQVFPTCGLATPERLIGEVDDARYFAHPDRVNCEILWFTRGYVEYMIPNLVPSNQKPTQITISAELSSEAPGVNNNWPSDIYFYLNDICLGMWTSPGDFGDVKGIFTPDWWYSNWNQYGLLKLIVVNEEGTFIDGIKISSVSVSDLKIDNKSNIRFKFEVPGDTEHVGGLTLFGRNFGNYNQDIHVTVNYAPIV